MKKVIISGSSSGIGKAIAQRLLDEQYTVVGLARDHTKYAPVNLPYVTYDIDLEETNQLENKLKAIRTEHPTMDALILSAGYGQFGELEQWSLRDMQRMMTVNFISQAAIIKAWLPHMKQQKQGRIIVIGSECALQGAKKASIYCASKFALRGFCQSLRQECASAHIPVTLVNPGLTRTPFFDKLSFKPAPEEANALTAGQIADVVIHLMLQQVDCVVEEINLQPLQARVEKQ